ncbi:MAG: SHOCT domain-containing protein [Defluviitaleaceae bacterium]|nr:SHOCT domain-containing protein [Defluviitaleaceae bacterium]
MISELSVIMRDLPQEVRNVKDAVRVSEKLNETSTHKWKGEIKRTIGMILPDEKIYFIAWGVDCTATGEDGMDDTETGLVFFSDKRFLFTPGWQSLFVMCPIEEILTVASEKSGGDFYDGGKISFRTANMDVTLQFAFTTKVNRVREMIIQIASNAVCGNTGSSPGGASAVCECSGCGASVIIHANIVNKCEYCDRYVETRDASAVAPVAASPGDIAPVSVADELKKYKDLKLMGAISDEEFEVVKEKLLSRL